MTIRLFESTLEYFQDLAKETGVPYQTLINYYLDQCAMSRLRPGMRWSRRK